MKKSLDELIHNGLVDAAIFWYQTYGTPFEIFKEWVETTFTTKGQQINFLYNLDKKKIIKLRN